MIRFLKQKNKNNSGFTLVETLVAVSIFTVSVLALMMVLSNSLSNANYAKRKLVATFLAQEGVEYMRNLRDTYVLYEPSPPPPPNQNRWVNFKGHISDCNSACYFDHTEIDFFDQSQPIIDMPIVLCPAQNCSELFYDSLTGEYNYDVAGINSGYIRKIQISDVTGSVNGDEVKVISTVSYSTPSGTKSISLEENLFNWTK